MQRLTQFIDRGLNATLVLCMATLAANVIWQVASRYLFNDPSSVTEEIAQFLLLWIGLLGGCYAYRQKSHLGLDLVTAKFPASAQQSAESLVALVTVLFAALVMVYGGGRLVWLTLQFKQTSPALGIPMGYVYSVLPLSGILIIYYAFALRRDERR